MSILLTDGRWKIDAAPQGARMDLAHGPSSIQAIDPARHPSLAGREDVKRAISHEASAAGLHTRHSFPQLMLKNDTRMQQLGNTKADQLYRIVHICKCSKFELANVHAGPLVMGAAAALALAAAGLED